MPPPTDARGIVSIRCRLAPLDAFAAEAGTDRSKAVRELLRAALTDPRARASALAALQKEDTL